MSETQQLISSSEFTAPYVVWPAFYKLEAQTSIHALLISSYSYSVNFSARLTPLLAICPVSKYHGDCIALPPAVTNRSATMDTSQFLLSPIGSLPCAPSPLAQFTDTFDLPPSSKSEFADNLLCPPPFFESSSLSAFRFPTEKEVDRTQFASRNPYRRERNTSPPRLRRIRTLDLTADNNSMSSPSSPSPSRSPSPPPYGYCETFEEESEEEDISAEEHAILAARCRAVHAERVARYHEQELSFRIRNLRASRSQPSSPSSSPGSASFPWTQPNPTHEDPVTEAEYRRARAEVRRRRRSERMRIIELGNLLDARRARISPPQTPPPSYESSALGLSGTQTPASAPLADQIVARMILKRRESASLRAPSHGLETRRSSSSLRFEALSLSSESD
ncbi:hypothetical protein OPQ81_002371 [Rhizoctonia solani]|nr:hypothetical protein OPQ81_002371 [Rhizoctonia solani]